jgi:NAD(P)-dependent dehydrogenase (short-subunit alcohol dehydrogenase family)
MDLQLAGKSALVTGSTVGIGRGIARQLAREGASVIVNGRTRERVDTCIESIGESDPEGDVQGVAADLSTVEGVETVTDAYPDLDILINNVGIFENRPFEEINDERWFEFFEVNVMSGVRLSRFYLPRMLEENWGRIVFISSENALQTPVEGIHYGLTKTAQLSLGRGLAEMTKGSSVTVNSVLPGPTESEGVDNVLEDAARERDVTAEDIKERFFDTARPSSLIQRFIEPGEVGNFVAFICSPLAAAINGTALRIDGGVVENIF